MQNNSALMAVSRNEYVMRKAGICLNLGLRSSNVEFKVLDTTFHYILDLTTFKSRCQRAYMNSIAQFHMHSCAINRLGDPRIAVPNPAAQSQAWANPCFAYNIYVGESDKPMINFLSP